MTPPVMIFAAGRGERLRPLTDHTPKPLIAVAGEPLLERQLRQLAAGGVRDVVINLHHLGELIEQRIGDGSRFGLKVRYSREPQKLETGGGLHKALPLLGEGPLWLLNGDVVMTLPLATFPQLLPEGSDMHLLLTPRPEARERGDFEFDGARITGWGDGFVYAGMALIDSAYFRNFALGWLGETTATAREPARPGALPDAGATRAASEPPGSFSLKEVFLALVAQGRITGSLLAGPWIDIGSPAQLSAANRLLGKP